MLKRPEHASLQGFYLFAKSKPRDATYNWMAAIGCAFDQYSETLAVPIPLGAQPQHPLFKYARPHDGENAYAIKWGALTDRLEAALVTAV